ncbi:MAG: 3-deoxy-D-manno-octulosonic acid kinase [Steroidobacter sp.]
MFIDMQQPVTSKIAGGILYEPSLFGKPEPQLFEPAYWLSRDTAASIQGGRGQVLFIHDGDRRWVLRHYRRGGLIARFNKDRYLWRGAETTRSFREWRLLTKLIGMQLPVPVPVAARYVRGLVSYRADLITMEIPGARSLSSLLMNSPMENARWQQLGRTLARFHKLGVHHADLNAHNIVLDQMDAIYVLDFDRGTIRSPERAWIDAVLARLLRSLNKLKAQRDIHFNDENWQQLRAAHDSFMTAG